MYHRLYHSCIMVVSWLYHDCIIAVPREGAGQLGPPRRIAHPRAPDTANLDKVSQHSFPHLDHAPAMPECMCIAWPSVRHGAYMVPTSWQQTLGIHARLVKRETMSFSQAGVCKNNVQQQLSHALETVGGVFTE